MSVIEFPQRGVYGDEPESVTWLRVTEQVTIAYAGRMFAGMVARQNGRFTAHDLFGRPCGVFTSIREAKRCVQAVLAHPSVRSWLSDAALPEGDRDGHVRTSRTRHGAHRRTRAPLAHGNLTVVPPDDAA
jgi:hypothetical protein